MTLKKGSFTVRLVYSRSDDSFAHTADLIGPCDIVHSMFGVFCSICDDDLIQETLAMLSGLCSGYALFPVASEGRFPEDLADYDMLRKTGRADPSVQEKGVIAYQSRHRRADGGWDDFGWERYKVFTFETFHDVVARGRWQAEAEFAVNTAPPMQLSKDWPAALGDLERCRLVNDRLKRLDGPEKEAYRIFLARETMPACFANRLPTCKTIPMADDIQKLELADDLFPALMRGEKTNTLRWQEGPVQTGYLLFYATHNPDWRAVVWVTGVQACPMNEIAPFYTMSPEELHKAMLRHYPDIEINSDILFIEHLSPEKTRSFHGIPAAFKGQTLIAVQDL